MKTKCLSCGFSPKTYITFVSRQRALSSVKN